MTSLELISLAALCAWLALALDRSRAWPRSAVLPGIADRSIPTEVSLVAIVPARNEAALLRRTLPALADQLSARIEIIVVDDGSTDDTSEIARRVARACGASERVQVVESLARPVGWSGKVQALQRGYLALLEHRRLTQCEPPDWLLLTDADILHRPGSVESLLRQALDERDARRYELVSVMARLRVDHFWERLTIPAFVFFFQLLYPFRRVAARRSRVAAAAGGCVLLHRRTLESAGGFESIRGALIDDIALAQRVRAVGGRLWLGFDAGIRSLRGYPRLTNVWRMVARTAFTQLRHRWDLLAITLLLLMLLVASPPALLASGALELLFDGGARRPSVVRALLWSAAAWLLMARALLPAVRHHRAPRAFAFGLPLAGALFALMTLSSAWRFAVGRGPQWRGREYGDQ